MATHNPREGRGNVPTSSCSLHHHTAWLPPSRPPDQPLSSHRPPAPLTRPPDHHTGPPACRPPLPATWPPACATPRLPACLPTFRSNSQRARAQANLPVCWQSSRPLCPPYLDSNIHIYKYTNKHVYIYTCTYGGVSFLPFNPSTCTRTLVQGGHNSPCHFKIDHRRAKDPPSKSQDNPI